MSRRLQSMSRCEPVRKEFTARCARFFKLTIDVNDNLAYEETFVLYVKGYVDYRNYQVGEVKA